MSFGKTSLVFSKKMKKKSLSFRLSQIVKSHEKERIRFDFKEIERTKISEENAYFFLSKAFHFSLFIHKTFYVLYTNFGENFINLLLYACDTSVFIFKKQKLLIN